MKVALALLCLFAAATAADLSSGRVGICVERCSMKITQSRLLRSIGVGQCPKGQVCASNGCGHTCQTVKKGIFKSKCPKYMCLMACENGFKTGSDGCFICQCKESPIFG